jgi:hypothetical protein
MSATILLAQATQGTHRTESNVDPVLRRLVDGSLLGVFEQSPVAFSVACLGVALLASLGYVFALPNPDQALRPEQVAARPTSRTDLRGRRMALNTTPEGTPGNRLVAFLAAVCPAAGMVVFGLGLIVVLS